MRPDIASAVADVAALPAEKRQVALAEAGLLAPHWPRPHGKDASPAEQLIIDQEMAAAGVERQDLVIGWWAAPTILEHGSPEQVQRFVPATLRGELIWCQLFSEPGAGSDLASLRTRAVRAEGRLAAHRAEGVDVGGAQGALGRVPGTHRRGCPEAQGHHLFPRRHEIAGHRDPAAARNHRCRIVQRGVLRRRFRARRHGRRPGERRVGGWPAPRWPTSESRWPMEPR